MIHCTSAVAAVCAAPFGVLLALQRRGLRWGKNLERCMWQGRRQNRGRQTSPFVLLAHTVFLPACHHVISETKVEVGIDLKHS